MTDHESEELYQSLRRKLEDYGSPPPETVWAGIQSQLPRRRRRRPLLLLLFLGLGLAIVGLTVGTGQWQRFAPAGLANPSAAEQLLAAHGAGSTASTRLHPALVGTSDQSPASADKAAHAAPGAPTTVSGAATQPNTPGPAARRRTVIDRVRARRWLGSADVAGHPKRTTRHRSDASSAAFAGGPTDATRNDTRRRRRKLGWLAAGQLANRTAAQTRSGRLGSPNHSESLARTTSPHSGTGRHASSAQSAALAGGGPGAAADQAKHRRFKISNAPLKLLVVQLAQPEPAEPEVRARRRTRKRAPSKRELRLRNWSAQVLLGSGVTYRALGGSSTQLEGLERPALGFTGQATAAYAFSRQLTVAAGLGYSEYANSLHYQLKKATDETVQQKDFRDVYRFLTVPVQAQLTLGRSLRWRYGVLGGGTLAFLTGARTTEGSACNCGQRQWTNNMPTMPFQRTNLLVSGGAFASYQFALGQWLTIRPQGQLFLNSLTTPTSNRAARRPWSLGVQAGYSWDLDPRSH